METLAKDTFEYRGKKYQVEILDGYKGEPCYNLSKETFEGVFEKIPCMSDAEEKRFPVIPAWYATMFLRGYNAGRCYLPEPKVNNG